LPATSKGEQRLTFAKHNHGQLTSTQRGSRTTLAATRGREPIGTYAIVVLDARIAGSECLYCTI
jgi:hypothetical protein